MHRLLACFLTVLLAGCATTVTSPPETGTASLEPAGTPAGNLSSGLTVKVPAGEYVAFTVNVTAADWSGWVRNGNAMAKNIQLCWVTDQEQEPNVFLFERTPRGSRLLAFPEQRGAAWLSSAQIPLETTLLVIVFGDAGPLTFHLQAIQDLCRHINREGHQVPTGAGRLGAHAHYLEFNGLPLVNLNVTLSDTRLRARNAGFVGSVEGTLAVASTQSGSPSLHLARLRHDVDFFPSPGLVSWRIEVGADGQTTTTSGHWPMGSVYRCQLLWMAAAQVQGSSSLDFKLDETYPLGGDLVDFESASLHGHAVQEYAPFLPPKEVAFQDDIAWPLPCPTL